jgi:hypothetical protein
VATVKALPSVLRVRRSAPHTPDARSKVHWQVAGAPALLRPHQLGAQTPEFGVADRPGFFQPIELFDFICGTKAALNARDAYPISRYPSRLHRQGLQRLSNGARDPPLMTDALCRPLLRSFWWNV